MAATPFIAPYLIGALTEVRVRRMLDVGCGTGVYSRIALEANRSVHVDAIDLAQEVIETAGDEFRRDGLSHRIDFHEGDVRDWIEGTSPKFDLILLMNSIYYFDPAIRVDLLRRLASALQPSGQLLVVSMTNPGSVASAHLDFMLRCQGGAASLPSVAGLESDLRHAGLEIADRRQLVPTEPFVGIRARRAHRLSGEA